MKTYSVNFSDPVVLSDQTWEQLSRTLENAWDLLYREDLAGTGQVVGQALRILDNSRMRPSDGLLVPGTAIGQAVLASLEYRLEHALARAFQDKVFGQDALAGIMATVSDLYFEANDPEARERCAREARQRFAKLPTLLASLNSDTLPAAVEALAALRRAVSRYQYTTGPDDQALVKQWERWLDFALQHAALGNAEAVQFALEEIRESAEAVCQKIFVSRK